MTKDRSHVEGLPPIPDVKKGDIYADWKDGLGNQHKGGVVVDVIEGFGHGEVSWAILVESLESMRYVGYIRVDALVRREDGALVYDKVVSHKRRAAAVEAQKRN